MSPHRQDDASFNSVTVVINNRKLIDSLLSEERLAQFAETHGFVGEDYDTVLDLYFEEVGELVDALTPKVSVIVVS